MSHITKPVVVAVAGKQPSTLRFAIREARLFGSGLRVVHAASLPAQAIGYYVGVDERALEEVRISGQAVLDDARHFVDEIDPALEVDYVLVEREPVEALRPEADSARAVVVGADDVPWLERLMRTRIAGYLAMHAPCPVIVVPEHEMPTPPGGEVVLTLDGETSAPGPVSVAFEEADARDCVLHVIHVAPPGTLATDAEAARANVSEVIAGWCETYPDVTVIEVSALGEVDAAIVSATRSAELVIMGRPHNDRIPLSLSRPLAMKVLRGARCPVAVVPSTYLPGQMFSSVPMPNAGV